MQDDQEQPVASNVADDNVPNGTNANVTSVTNITDLNVEKKKRGNPTWGKGMQSPNPAGRPIGDPREKMSNRSLREKSLMQLIRKFNPHIGKAVMTAVKIMDNEKASESNKLKAGVFITQTYRELLNEVYSKDYDDDQGEEIQDNSPIFSLKMISDEKVA